MNDPSKLLGRGAPRTRTWPRQRGLPCRPPRYRTLVPCEHVSLTPAAAPPQQPVPSHWTPLLRGIPRPLKGDLQGSRPRLLSPGQVPSILDGSCRWDVGSDRGQDIFSTRPFPWTPSYVTGKTGLGDAQSMPRGSMSPDCGPAWAVIGRPRQPAGPTSARTMSP